MNNIVYPFLAALRFLTVIPVSLYAEKDSSFFQASVRYFVLIGLLIGGVGFICTKIATYFIPHPVLCCLIMLYSAAISGFLHLDGFTDTCDGFFSSQPRERILKIMDDSRVGAMGVISIFFLLFVKFASLSALPPEILCYAAFLMPVSGRAAIVLTMQVLPYARSEGGLGSLFYGRHNWTVTVYSALFYVLSMICIPASLVIYAFCIMLFTTLVFCWWSKKMIGGATGDTLGAGSEINETVLAAALAIAFY